MLGTVGVSMNDAYEVAAPPERAGSLLIEDGVMRIGLKRKAGLACNRVQGATAPLASTAIAAT